MVLPARSRRQGSRSLDVLGQSPWPLPRQRHLVPCFRSGGSSLHGCRPRQGEGFAVDASVIEADASRYHGKAPDEIDWSLPERQTRAVAEFLTAFDDDDPTADRKLPKVISPVDPCSAWTAKANKRVQFGYGLNYLIDIENAVIVDVEATPARTYDEVATTKTMVKRTDKQMGLKPKYLAADTAYGTGKFLSWLIGAGIMPYIPVWDMSQREDGTFSRAAGGPASPADPGGPCGPVQAANTIIAMAARMVTTCRISAPGETRTLRLHGDCGQAGAPCANQHEHLPPVPARLRCKGMSSPPPSTAHVLELISVKLAVHEQREVDLTGQRRRTGLLQQ
jgi:hypothetical protein